MAKKPVKKKKKQPVTRFRIVVTLFMIIVALSVALAGMLIFLRHRTADNIKQLVGDGLLTRLVVHQGEFLKQVVGIVGSDLHGHGTGSMLGCIRIEQHRVELQAEHLG